MFKQEKSAGYISRKTFWKKRQLFRFWTGSLIGFNEYSYKEICQLAEWQRQKPVKVLAIGVKNLWWFRDVFYVEDENFAENELRALAIADTEKRKRRLERAVTISAIAERPSSPIGEPPRDRQIPREVRMAVWQRDRGRCVVCGGNVRLEFDHIVPFSLGGSNTERNVQLLCEACNRSKGSNVGFGPPSPEASSTFQIVTCSRCSQKIRLPKGRGTLRVTCPQCSERFVTRT